MKLPNGCEAVQGFLDNDVLVHWQHTYAGFVNGNLKSAADYWQMIEWVEDSCAESFCKDKDMVTAI